MSVQDIIGYVEVTLIVAILFFIPFLWIRYRYLKNNGKWPVTSWKREMVVLGFVFYIIALYQITAFRFGGIGWSIDKIIAKERILNLDPLEQVWRWARNGYWSHLFYNVGGNCAWFIPLGIMIPSFFYKQRNLVKVVLIGALVSCSIELLQYILCTGVSDINDVIFNTIGAGMGYLLFIPIYKLYEIYKTLKYNNI